MPSKTPKGDGYNAFPAIHLSTTKKLSVASATARTTSAFSPGVSIVRVATSKACYIKFGSSSVEAANTDVYMPDGAVEYFGIPEGGETYLAAIRSTEDGLLTVTEGLPG